MITVCDQKGPGESRYPAGTVPSKSTCGLIDSNKPSPASIRERDISEIDGRKKHVIHIT